MFFVSSKKNYEKGIQHYNKFNGVVKQNTKCSNIQYF